MVQWVRIGEHLGVKQLIEAQCRIHFPNRGRSSCVHRHVHTSMCSVYRQIHALCSYWSRRRTSSSLIASTLAKISCSISADNCRTVGASNNERKGRSTSNVSATCKMICEPSNEWPPSTKKF